MTDLPFNVLVFDLDGTLADTAPDLTTALNRTLATIDRPSLDGAAVRLMVGNGVRALLRRGLAATGSTSDELVERVFPKFIEYYRADICSGTRAYPGVERALDDLADAGLTLAICTNKPEGLTGLLIEKLGWADRFAAIVGGDTLAVRKPDPAPLLEAVARAGGGNAAFVGDSITDVSTARAADLPIVAVSFGFADRPAAELGADLVIDRFEDLLPALRRLSSLD
jgi:phosphoglycolate phosphatase